MNVLIFAPHPDDEIIGCGGSIAKFVDEGHEVFVAIVTRGVEPLFSEEQVSLVKGECYQADKFLGVKKTIFLNFPATMLETVPRHDLNKAFCSVISDIQPSIVFIPHRGDMQLDHKLVSDAAMVALRPKYKSAIKKIYAYETLSETGWDLPNTVNEFIPTVYNDISKYLDKKIEALNCFKSQLSAYPHARSLEAVRALAMFRGSTMSICAAEAFTLIREIIC